ncbi:MAG: hypothetical protein ABIE70_04420 [bacterium]
MKSTLMTLSLILLPLMAMAQVDEFGSTDTIYADLARIDDHNWTVTINYTNDEWIEALSLPFHLDAGDTRIVGDSAVYTGGCVERFDFKGFRADSAIQCITMGIMANMGPADNGLPPGSGRLVTVFVSSMDETPIEKLTIDSTTTHPTNSLMTMAQRVQLGDPPDTVPDADFEKLAIVPAFVIRYAK